MPICQGVELTNLSDIPIAEIVLKCEGNFIVPFESNLIARIDSGETVRVAQFKINPDAAKLAALTERVSTEFTISAVGRDGDPIATQRFSLELMPYDHWTGLTILPQTICSFITPNHPAIAGLVAKSAAMLKKRTGSSVLSEYQSGDGNAVRHQVAAVFEALHDSGLVYRALPASYEEIGQRVTMPDRVLDSKIGNCIELTLLMASVLESIGINCVIIFQKGHAYLGVWLIDDCHRCSVSDDPSFIEKRCAEGISEMMVIECTHIAQENASFEDAVSAARMNLAQLDKFELFVDVKRSRLERVFPLPARIETNGVWTVESTGVDHDSCRIEVREHDPFTLNGIVDNKRELTKFDIWERKLLDFSLRNSLLNLSPRRRAVQFISFDINRIEDHLQDGKEYCIASKPNVDFEFDKSGNLIRSKLLEPLHELIRTDIERHHTLHTFMSDAETKTVLKNIYRAARNAIEETGANSLFLAIGTVRWYENELSAMPRYAPLLLLPVEMVYKKGNYYIRTNDEEISLNITLIEFLRQNHDIAIPGLDPLPLDDSGVDVPLIFAIVRDALKSRNRWDVEEECLLGTFSFSKFLMWNDIHTHRDKMGENDVISSLVANRLTWTPSVDGSQQLKDIDANISPTNIALPVAVDSSQLAAVIEGGKGNSFILYGPPGTGKSQTITNLIANALYHGKRVLFVAEKMAALNVVQSRLEKIGLDPFCLELHSNKSTKRHVLQQLEKALRVTHIVTPVEYERCAEKIFRERKDLIAYLTALHTKNHPDGLSLYDTILRYESIEGEPLSDFEFDTRIDQLLKNEGTKGVEELLGNRFETVVKLVGQPSLHPLKGLKVSSEMLTDVEATVGRLRQAAAVLKDDAENADNLRRAAELRTTIERDNSADIFEIDPEQLRREWRAVKAKWFFVTKFFAKRAFLKQLRRFNELISANEVDPLIENLISYRDKHLRISELQRIIKSYFGLDYSGDEIPSVDSIKECVEDLERWSRSKDHLGDWFHWSELSADLVNNGLGCVVKAMESAEHDVAEIRKSFLKALFRHKANGKISGAPGLSTFEGMLFDQKTSAYKKLADEFQLLTQKELYARLASRVPRMTDNAVSGSEIGLLNRNISNGGRGQSLRDLFDQLPTLLPRLCPVMLMSPMSVAQYIDLDADKFDLVIFDEASQMPTSEAVGAIARGKALIVVGDPKQMPPTSFFSSTNVDADEAAIDDMESILEDCRTLEVPSLQLSWHYRSRHESLIAFSNNEYYDGSLITFPSVDDQRTKVRYVAVEGCYDKGGKRSNKAEAEAIVDEIVRRLTSDELRRRSIGVIAFSVSQQSLIEDLLQDRLDSDKSLQEVATQLYEPIFVKNLENVQGDERDVILFSIGYGPDKDGKVSMNFGPLNNAGGERRLNVAVSRARCEMIVFSSLKSTDIDLKRSKALGVEGLKHFLQYAETQMLPSVAHSRTARHNSLLADQIAEELRNRGYVVDTNVGRSQFRVDVAIERGVNSGEYILGILLDGEGYRDTPTTRDREVVQPSVLQSLDWKVMRVWSVDWFRNRERVVERIIEQIEKGSVEDIARPEIPVFDISDDEVELSKTNARSYNHYSIDAYEAITMSDVDIVGNVISAEQPVTLRYLCRRVNQLRGSGRVTPNMQNHFKALIRGYFIDENDTIWLSEADSVDYRSYRADSGREIADIPIIELHNAIFEVLQEQVALNEDNLTLLAAKKLGFARRGTLVDAAFRNAVAQLLAIGELEKVADNLRILQS